MHVSRLVLSAVLLSASLGAHATQPTEPPQVKRPATPQECDPSSWVVDPEVDYSVCEEGSVTAPAPQ